MVRSVLAIFGGFMSGFWLIRAVSALGSVFYPPPPSLDPAKQETILEAIRSAPTGLLWILVVAYAFGTFVSSGIASRIAGTWKIGHGMVIGGLVLFNCLGQMSQLPYPLWFKITGAGVILPMAFLGSRLVTLAPTEKPASVDDLA